MFFILNSFVVFSRVISIFCFIIDFIDDEFADFSKFGDDQTSSSADHGEFADFSSANVPSPPSGQNSPTASAPPTQPAANRKPVAHQTSLLDDLSGLSLDSNVSIQVRVYIVKLKAC